MDLVRVLWWMLSWLAPPDVTPEVQRVVQKTEGLVQRIQVFDERLKCATEAFTVRRNFRPLVRKQEDLVLRKVAHQPFCPVPLSEIVSFKNRVYDRVAERDQAEGLFARAEDRYNQAYTGLVNLFAVDPQREHPACVEQRKMSEQFEAVKRLQVTLVDDIEWFEKRCQACWTQNCYD